MPQHVPNLYGTTIPNSYERTNTSASTGEVNRSDSSRNCKRGSEGSTKQRKKASRACDQCRKKRIKCRFDKHSGVCQGCLEVGEKCLFVRVPLKRGPAKKRSTGISSENFSLDNDPLHYRPRTHSYPMNLGDNHLPSLARNSSFPSISSLFIPPITTQSQQFVKVPYDDIKRRRSLATLHSDSSISTEFGGNYRLDQNLGIGQEGKDIAMKGTITPVEETSACSSNVRRQGSQSFPLQEQRANPYINPFIFGRSRLSSISYTSEATTSEGNTQSKDQYMLTPNSVRSVEKERLNSLTAGCSNKKSSIDDKSDKWEKNSTWKPVYRSADPSRSNSGKTVPLKQEASVKPPILSANRQYDEISFCKVLDIYYDFFHINFPIIPINKNKFTGMLIPKKPQVFDETQKISNEIIERFKTALEILVFCKIKQRRSSKSTKSWSRDNLCDFQKGLYYIQNFNKCIDDCFRSLITVKSILRQNSSVIPSRIKFIYFSTMIMLNFILILTGDESSLLLGPSVGVFNEFKAHKLFLPFENTASMPLLNSNEKIDDEQLDYAVLFKRSYILLNILDTLQSFRLGQPKLINLNFGSPIGTYFSDEIGHNQIVEKNPIILDNILRNLKLGEFITYFVLNRKSLQVDISQHLLFTNQTDYEDFAVDKGEHNDIADKFQFLLKKKESLIRELLNIEQKNGHILKTSWNSDAEMNKIGELVCSMITLTSGILDSIANVNAENSVDLDSKPLPNTYSETDSEEESMSPTQRITPNLANEENKRYTTKYLTGTVSVFILPMVEECSNIIRLIGPIPTTLISLYIRNGNMAKGMNNRIMMLSTALNELVQITALFNVLEPFRQNVHDLAKRYNADAMSGNGCYKSVMKNIYSGKCVASNASNVAPLEEENKKILEKFADIGWKLMDDSELGCCCCFSD
ncbi:Eds1p [Saccharomyces paradoxus]|uniref:Eds1p n=1 Tax=Saccharomyces paradoxus TaxID=27291 RepID=A0A8B8ULI6_SACPA|nr:Eds1 [Saccharomyces paradoxus]QHS71597.1 Eds1 [Saccharomyces paradoxus]